uniref:Zgc:110425 n=1 Tax=Xiphophorus maculatus TaxID=8083 RepID=A0A3B5PRH8_XIPMA
MAEEAPAAVKAPAKAPKKKSAPRAKKDGPSLSKLIVAAVADSKERKGVSLAALKKVLAGKGVDVAKANKRINTAVTKLVTGGTLSQTKGTGASGSFKLLSGQQEAHGRLDLPGGDGGALVVVSQAGRLGGDALEDVVDERVHDAHGLGRDAGIGVDLLQHLVHVDGVALLPGLSLLLASLAGRLGHGFLGALLGRRLGGFGHPHGFLGNSDSE